MKFESLLALLFVCWSFRQTNGECYDLVKQYYECKHLVMISSNGNDYKPDKNVKNNFLDDTFYQSKGLGDMGFDQGMELIQSIYNEVDFVTLQRCDSYLCKCVINRTSRYYNDDNYGFFFRDNFDDFKSIVSEFDQIFQDNRDSLEKFTDNWSYDLPTLAKFAYINEFTPLRKDEYTSIRLCYTNNYVLYYDCIWKSRVDNGKVIGNMNSAQLESKLLCKMLISRKCSNEQQRFELANILAVSMANLAAQTPKNSLIGLADRVINQAVNYDIQEDGGYFYVKIKTTSQKNKFELRNFQKKRVVDALYIYSVYKKVGSNYELLLVQSDSFNLSCEISLEKNPIDKISFLNHFDKIHLKSLYNGKWTGLSVDVKTFNSKNSGMFIKNDDGIDIFQVFFTSNRLEIYDLKLNLLVIYTDEMVSVLSSVSLLKSALEKHCSDECKGALIDGNGLQLLIDDPELDELEDFEANEEDFLDRRNSDDELEDY